jgi:hypothetical protein
MDTVSRAPRPGGVQARESTMTTILKTLSTLTLTAATAAALAQGVAMPDSQRYDAARDEYEIGHFQLAFAEFATLADRGHCDAARMALQMLRHGKPLYATEFQAAPERVQRWQQLPACGVALARR